MATLKIKANNKANNESANAAKQVSNPESPMMKQFRDLKAKHPERILLFRCGDFYECYREDAKAVSEVCGTTLTFRDFGEHVDFTMFPHQGLDKYLPMLIRAGKHVAICDQLEKPTPAPSLKEREDKAVTVPLGEHGTLVIGKPGFEPKEDKPKVTLKKKTPQPAEEPISGQPVDEQPDPNGEPDPDAVGEIVEVTSATSELPVVKYSTYKTKKGNTAPQIIGFGGPDDPRWQSHKDKAHKWCLVSWKKDLSGEKVYILLFGTRYMDAAKALCEAYNSGDAKAIEAAEGGCQAVYEQAQADGKARWEAKKAEWAAKKAAKNSPTPEPLPEGEGSKGYDDKAVAEMLQAIMDGGDIPEDIKRYMKTA